MLENWLKSIEERATAAEANGEAFGACLLPDPNGGPPLCVQLDQSTCKNLRGTFLGGDCANAVAEAKPDTESKKPRKKPK